MNNFEKKETPMSLDPELAHGIPDSMPVLLDCPEHGGNRWAAVDEKGIFVCSDCEPNRPRIVAADLKTD